jgi:hypothetical protein
MKTNNEFEWQGKRREQVDFSATIAGGTMAAIVLLCAVLAIIQNFFLIINKLISTMVPPSGAGLFFPKNQVSKIKYPV